MKINKIFVCLKKWVRDVGILPTFCRFVVRLEEVGEKYQKKLFIFPLIGF